MSSASSALMFSNLSNFHVQGGDYTTEILEAIGEIEQQKTFSCDDVINILKGFQIYKENKPSAALRQKLTRWVETYGKKHIDIARDAFQILKYSEGVIDAGTLQPLLRACRERRENLLDEEKLEFDAICRHQRFAEYSSFTPNSTEQSEISEDNTSRSRAAAQREPRENDLVRTFNHERNMPNALFQDAFPIPNSNPPVSNQAVLRTHKMMKGLFDKNQAGGGDGLQTSATGGGDGLQTSATGRGDVKNTEDRLFDVIGQLADALKKQSPDTNVSVNVTGGSATAGNDPTGRSWCGGLFYCSLCGMGTTATAAVAILTAAYIYLQNPLAIFETIPDVVLESLKKSGGAWASGDSNITNKERKHNVRDTDERKGGEHTGEYETKGGEHTGEDTTSETKGGREIYGFELAMRELDCFAEPNSECVNRQVQYAFNTIKFGVAGLRKVAGPAMGFERGFWIVVIGLISGGSFNSIRPMATAGSSFHHRNNNFNPTRRVGNAAVAAMERAASEIANLVIKCEPFTRP
jgi:hypothetical protein